MPDPRILCGVCPFPAVTLQAAKLARQMADAVHHLSTLVTDQQQAQRVQMLALSIADQAAELLKELPTAEFFEDEDNTP